MNNKKGFTLVELLSVIVILGLILAIVIPAVSNVGNSSKEAFKNSKINILETAATKYGNDRLNDYQNCVGSSSDLSRGTICVRPVNDVVNDLVSYGYLQDADTAIDPITNETFDGSILFCYKSSDISIEAHHLSKGGSYSCSSEFGTNYLNLTSSTDTIYIGNSVSVGIIKIGDFTSFSCPSPANGLRVSCDSSSLTVTALPGVEPKSYTITLTGNYNDGTSKSLKVPFEAKIEEVKFDIDRSNIVNNYICLENGKSIEIPLASTNKNVGDIHFSSTSNVFSGNAINEKIYITAQNVGSTAVTLSESNGNISTSLYGNVYSFRFQNSIPSSMLVGESVSVSYTYEQLDQIRDIRYNSEYLTLSDISSTSFKIYAKKEGKTEITIVGTKDGNNCFTKTFTVEIGSSALRLLSTPSELFIGGSSFSTILYSDYLDRVECISDNTSALVCTIDKNTLTLTPKTSPSDLVNVSIKLKGINSNDIVNSISFNVKVSQVLLSLEDSNGNTVNEDTTICRDIDASGNDNTVYIKGSNVNEAEIGNPDTADDWCLVDSNIIGDTLDLRPRTNVLESAAAVNTTCSRFIVANGNTGRARVNVTSRITSNITRSFYYNIYSLNLSKNSGSVNVGDSLSFTMTYSYTGSEMTNNSYKPNVTSSDENIASVRVSTPTRVSGNNGNVANLTKQATVTVKGESPGSAIITIRGTTCGERTYTITVNGNSTCPNISSYSGIYDGNQHTITINNTASNGTTYYSLNGGMESTSLPYARSVGEYTIDVKVKGSSFYLDRTCDSSSITINNAEVKFNANGGSLTSGSTTLYARMGETSMFSGIRNSIITAVPVASRTGYNFNGWNDSNGTKVLNTDGNLTNNSTLVSSNGQWTLTDNYTLYADLTRKTYSLSYDANGGEGAPDTQTITYNNPYNLSAIIPTRTGYKFLGWSENKDDTNYTYDSGQEDISIYKNYILYAIWEKDENIIPLLVKPLYASSVGNYASIIYRNNNQFIAKYVVVRNDTDTYLHSGTDTIAEGADDDSPIGYTSLGQYVTLTVFKKDNKLIAKSNWGNSDIVIADEGEFDVGTPLLVTSLTASSVGNYASIIYKNNNQFIAKYVVVRNDTDTYLHSGTDTIAEGADDDSPIGYTSLGQHVTLTVFKKDNKLIAKSNWSNPDIVIANEGEFD